jgi:hypothetical protein
MKESNSGIESRGTADLERKRQNQWSFSRFFSDSEKVVDMSSFTPEKLVEAIKNLFELNHYDVTGPQQIHGAEVDLIAKARNDPFAVPIYIEATIEHVDNNKYGKDVGKLAMVAELDRDVQRLIESFSGLGTFQAIGRVKYECGGATW